MRIEIERCADSFLTKGVDWFWKLVDEEAGFSIEYDTPFRTRKAAVESAREFMSEHNFQETE